MWSRIVLLSAVAWVVLYASSGLAQEPDSEPGNLFLRTRVRLEIRGGRITVVNRGCGQSRTTVANSPTDDTRQTLSVQLQKSAVVVNYEAVAAGQTLLMEVCEQSQLILVRQALDGSQLPEIRFQQAADGKVTLNVGGPAPQQYAAASFWHLMLAQPEVCRQHLLPLLETLRPNWRLDEQAAAIEALVLNSDCANLLAARERWQKHVDDLKSDDFKTRQAADRALRDAGQGVVAFLRKLDPHTLEAEQRQRIRAICSQLPAASRDTPERVATWLADDTSVWLALLDRGDLKIRVAAAEHLSELCRHSLPFDPEANALQRQAQLQKLRARLADN